MPRIIDEEENEENESVTTSVETSDDSRSSSTSDSIYGYDEDEDADDESESSDGSKSKNSSDHSSDSDQDHLFDEDPTFHYYQYSDVDPETPRPSSPHYTAEYIIAWITGEAPKKSMGYDSDAMDYEEYWHDETIYPEEIDYQSIAENTEQNEINQVIADLLQRNGYFESIKSLVEACHEDELDSDLLQDCLYAALSKGYEEDIAFFLDHGANRDQAIQHALHEFDSDWLELLNVVMDDELLKRLDFSDELTLEIVQYFLETNFSNCSQEIITFAGKKNNAELVSLVCEHAIVDDAYDLLSALVKAGGKNLFYLFFEHFDPKELLTVIQEQNDDDRFYELTLAQAKRYVSEQDMPHDAVADLLADFEENLIINQRLLIYPKENFTGDAELKKIRESLDKALNLLHSNRVAVNFIGVSFSTFNRIFNIASPYHQTPPHQSEHYFRSAVHPLSIFVKPANAQYAPHKSLPEAVAPKGNGREAHLGLYKPPIDSMMDHALRSCSKPASPTPTHTKKKKKLSDTENPQPKLYDQLLYFRQIICAHIQEQSRQRRINRAIQVGYHHQYPCIMVFIKKPNRAKSAAPAALAAWTEIIISYFVGMINYQASQKNISIELIRRSSFGFLTPTISPCKRSFRINVGIIPMEYANLIVECLLRLDNVLTALNQSDEELSSQQINMQLPADYFLTTEAYREYWEKKLGTKPRPPLPKAKNILELAWAKVERGGKSVLQNLARTSCARDNFARIAYNELTKNTESDAKIFLTLLTWGVKKIQAKGKTLSFIADQVPLSPQAASAAAIPQIKDQGFVNLIENIQYAVAPQLQEVSSALFQQTVTLQLRAITQFTKDKQFTPHFYFYLEMFNELLFSQIIYSNLPEEVDKFGSDSEVEDGPEAAKIYGKKIIVRNGMRSILAALHASAEYVNPNYFKEESEKIDVFLHGSYFETLDAVELLAKFSVRKSLDEMVSASLRPCILIYDINSCVTEGTPLQVPKKAHLKRLKSLILDSTSATTEKQRDWLELFKKSENLDILFFASSGFKNEQMGADKNPYGTLRIFTKNKALLNQLVDSVKEKEAPVQSSISHHYRRCMKTIGCVPTNADLLPRMTPSPS